MPLLRNFLQSLYVQYGRAYFHKRLDHCTTRDRGSSKLQYFPLRKGGLSRDRDGILFAKFSFVMVWICQHCFAPFVDSLYRVKSEESGVVFLDLIVCHGCYVQARELGLLTEKIGVGYRSPAETTAPQEKKPTLQRRATERRESRR
jgi:hypothetical protein